MFQSIKVKQYKGLKECILLGLRKINVLCGKNNSGKTTILEGINGQGRAVGRELTEKDYNSVFNSSLLQMGWSQEPHLDKLYKQVLAKLSEASAGRSWFSDETDKFVRDLKDRYDRSDLRGRTFAEPEIRKSFKALFTVPQTVLLPPKRHLEVSQTILQKQDVAPDGTGVLNYLFFAKNQRLTSEHRKFYDHVSQAFTDISSGYSFDIFPSEGNRLLLHLYFSYQSSSWIDAKACGLGLQDLMIILFFSLSSEHGEAILIEEPESHMHPDMQRKLLYFLKTETTKQFFLSTHSNIYLNSSLIDRIFYVYFDDSVKVDDATSKASILNNLGYSVTDNLVSDLIILVEGPTDRPVLEEFLIKMGVFGAYDIKIWPLGGDVMDQLDLSVFAERRNIIALVDNDRKSGRIRKRFIENCARYGIPVTRLRAYSIENYFSVNALKDVFGSQIPPSVTEIDPNKTVEDQIGLNPKKNNGKIAQAMSLDEIKGTDLYDFLLEVKRICEQGN